jgi:cell division protein FtsQ
MAGLISVSQKDLAQRRKKLRRQRQIKIIQGLWRTLAVSGVAGGLLWVALHPIWVLNAPQQIEMKSGDQLLSAAAIKSLVAISYPQSLWRIQTHAIANSLKEQPSIADARVNRRLFPPGLNIKIQERVPVALAVSSDKQSSAQLLDADGVLIPLEKYKLVNPNIQLPTLKVLGSPETYSSDWSQMYPILSHSHVKIKEIDWQDASNLILSTELGNVHLGGFTSQFSEQMKVLGQMRSLSAKMDVSEIKYIDLKNPASPLVHLHQSNPKRNSPNP